MIQKQRSNCFKVLILSGAISLVIKLMEQLQSVTISQSIMLRIKL